ncbi:RNase adapter RapZ [Roseitranquillus sediminis]|uniref:RNase adapter RapZ n=1 Tax=Roseitranquillus sediminis TaxID=2809051 RepID=UPI001D0CC6F0|nr:RNase adapter RapZ [Roseitranquillus sediminis]MBM9596301.1 RNase adapter RapZ [Roseitranquillus sediminis]
MSVRVVLVTGPAGAGRSTAIAALEDLGFEAIDNMPLSLVPRLFDGPVMERPLALGLDPRNRDFSPGNMAALVATLRQVATVDVLFLECRPDVLMRRFSETRRRHPMSPDADPSVGIGRETEMLDPVRDLAKLKVDTSELSPHELRARLAEMLGPSETHDMAISLQSFSYKRGLPSGLDLAFDVRFLRNPHWVPELRPLDGLDPAVAGHVAGDPRYDDFIERWCDLARILLPGYRDEGKSHLSIGFGCTGGQHRSVTVVEVIARALADDGWRVSTRHREIERRGPAADARDLG